MWVLKHYFYLFFVISHLPADKDFIKGVKQSVYMSCSFLSNKLKIRIWAISISTFTLYDWSLSFSNSLLINEYSLFSLQKLLNSRSSSHFQRILSLLTIYNWGRRLCVSSVYESPNRVQLNNGMDVFLPHIFVDGLPRTFLFSLYNHCLGRCEEGTVGFLHLNSNHLIAPMCIQFAVDSIQKIFDILSCARYSFIIGCGSLDTYLAIYLRH